MNKRQKLVQEQFLNDEEAVIKRLQQVYGQSLTDLNKVIFELDSSISMLQKAYDDIGDDIGELALAVLGDKAKYMTPAEAQETIKSMLQSKVYRKNYQTALQKQVGGILDKMHRGEFKTVSEYLTQCYENGFIGTMYDLQGQGIPMCFPLDQEQMVRAVQLDSKISKGLYSRLGEDVALLKRKITAQISRGIATGMSYQQVAQQLAGVSNIGYNNAVRIARTEGHRIQVQAGMDACYKAKERGADVVKQWDAALDDRTRESHAAVDGEIRELDEKFSNGLMFPGDPAGGAAEVINCRCALLQRARWELDEAELETLKKRAEYFGLDKAENFEDYKQKYLRVNNELTNTGAENDKITLEQCVDFDELKKYFVETYSIVMDDEVMTLDFEAVKPPLAGIESMLERFPEMSDTIKRIKVSKGGVMSCAGDSIDFNPVHYASTAKIQEMCDKYGASGWWVKNSNPASIGTHEAAHALEWLLCNMNPDYEYDWQRIAAYNDCKQAQLIVGQACKNVKKTAFGKGKKNAELKATISKYANDTPSEAMAEALADVYINGKDASPLSLEIEKLTVELYEKYKGGK